MTEDGIRDLRGHFADMHRDENGFVDVKWLDLFDEIVDVAKLSALQSPEVVAMRKVCDSHPRTKYFKESSALAIYAYDLLVERLKKEIKNG